MRAYACACVFLYLCADVCLLKCECGGQRTSSGTSLHLPPSRSPVWLSQSSWGFIFLLHFPSHAGMTDLSITASNFHVDPGDSSLGPRACAVSPLPTAFPPSPCLLSRAPPGWPQNLCYASGQKAHSQLAASLLKLPKQNDVLTSQSAVLTHCTP